MKKFLGEEGKSGIDDDSVKQNINKQSRLLSSENEKDARKELEARVLYKYPKGQFKFPLIPDTVEESLKVESKQVKKSSQSSPQATRPLYEAGADRESIPKVKKVDRENKPVMNKIEPPKNRQMFRPTQIPSPIFAFNRPKLEEEVEYEITGFSGEQDVEQQPREVVKRILEKESKEEVALTLEEGYSANDVEPSLEKEARGKIAQTIERRLSSLTRSS